MGIMDAFSAEDRVEVKFSDFYMLMKEAARAELLMNAAKCDVPHAYMREIMTGKQEERTELTRYQATGLSPEQVQQIDEEYARLCQEVAELREQNKAPQKAEEQPAEDTTGGGRTRRASGEKLT